MIGLSTNMARQLLKARTVSRICSVCGKGTKFYCSCGASVHPRCVGNGEHAGHLLRNRETINKLRKPRL